MSEFYERNDEGIGLVLHDVTSCLRRLTFDILHSTNGLVHVTIASRAANCCSDSGVAPVATVSSEINVRRCETLLVFNLKTILRFYLMLAVHHNKRPLKLMGRTVSRP